MRDGAAALHPAAAGTILSSAQNDYHYGVAPQALLALRLVFGGLFDRFPQVKVIMGHLGETLPYLLWRFDSRAKLYGVKLAKPPSQYIRENFMVTSSGMCSAEPLTCALSALGRDRVMFAADYPFESPQEAGHFIDSVPLENGVRNAICFDTAAKLLKLPHGTYKQREA